MRVALSLSSEPRKDVANKGASIQRASHRVQSQIAQEEAAMAVKSIREGFHTVTPYLMVQEAAKLIDFVKS
jgi:hypothetical protein